MKTIQHSNISVENAAATAAAYTKRKAKEDRHKKHQGKSFEQLSKNEKDELLKTLAIKAGLITDDLE